MVKAETIIGLTVIVAIGVVIGIFISYSPESITQTKEKSINTSSTNFTRFVFMGENICEGCHLSGKRYIPQAYQIKQHVEGGRYCLECHTINHNVHPINQNVTCERCHGAKTPKIPEFHGSIVCEECHNYPDPMTPSKGNLVVIHRPRGVDCMRCHTDSCLKCHDNVKSNKQWKKRLAHFNTLLRSE